MRYLAALFYAVAIAAHSGALLNTLMLGSLVFLGVVCTLFAVEGIVKDATHREPPTIAGTSLSEIFERTLQRREARARRRWVEEHGTLLTPTDYERPVARKSKPKGGGGWRGRH